MHAVLVEIELNSLLNPPILFIHLKIHFPSFRFRSTERYQLFLLQDIDLLLHNVGIRFLNRLKRETPRFLFKKILLLN